MRAKRGFALMTPERLREVCSNGGKSAHAKGVCHIWTSEEARAAGKKGGSRTKANRTLAEAAAPALPPAEQEPA